MKKFVLQFALKFLINRSCFDVEARGCAFHFVEIFSKNYEISNPGIKKMLKINNKITIAKVTIKTVVR